MARFEKTQLHWISAVLGLLGLYAIAGLAYAAWMHSDESIAIWATIAVAAFGASFAHQLYVKKKRPTR